MRRARRELVALLGVTRKELLVLLRYKGPLIGLALTAFLTPLSYYAQAEGFSGEDKAALEAFASRTGTTQLAGFLYLGFVVFLWISQILWGPGTALRQERVQGSLEPTLLTPVPRVTLLLGSALAQVLPAVVLFSTVGVVLRFVFGLDIGATAVLRGTVVVLASLPVLFAIGALLSVVTLGMRDADGVADALRGVIAVLCGVTYPVVVLPEWLRPISLALPPTQIIDQFRGAVLGSTVLGDAGSRALWLIGCGVVLGAAAVALLGRVLRRAQVTGRLGQF